MPRPGGPQHGWLSCWQACAPLKVTDRPVAGRRPPPNELHHGAFCSECARAIRGIRFACDYCWSHNVCTDCFRKGLHIRRHPDHKWKARATPGSPFVPLEFLPAEWWAPYLAAGTAQSLLRDNENSNSFRSLGVQRAAVAATHELIAESDGTVSREDVLNVLKENFALFDRAADHPREVLLALSDRGIPMEEACGIVAHSLMVRAKKEPQGVRVLLIHEWGMTPEAAESFIKMAKSLVLAPGEQRRDAVRRLTEWREGRETTSEAMQKRAAFAKHVSSGHPWALVRTALGGERPTSPTDRLRELMASGKLEGKSDPISTALGQRKYTSG